MPLDSAQTRDLLDASEGEAKLAVRVAQIIEQEVMEQGWQVGTTIGSEAELAGRLGVSRAVMREAISIVEHDGLLVSRRGRQGGLWVATPALEAVKTALRNYLYYASVDIADVLSTRLVLENLMIELASPHITADIYELATVAGDVSGANFGNTFRQQMTLIRRLLEPTQNPALSVFLLALIDLILGLMFRRGLAADELRRFSEQSARLRSEYVRHMFGGDLIRARQALHDLIGVGQGTLDAASETNELTESYPLRVALDLVMSPEELPLPVKGAEQLTHRIHAEIQRMGWPVEHSLGTEVELQKRFNVGRGVLREGIRPLERLGIVEMRTNTGLVVRRPDPTATIRSAALYLGHAGLTAQNARIVQNELELAGVGQLAASSPAYRAQSASLLQTRISIATNADNHVRQIAARQFYLDLIETLPNAVVALFLRILAELSYTNPRPSAATGQSPDFWRAIQADQQRLATAVANGNETLARRAMLDLQRTQQALAH